MRILRKWLPPLFIAFVIFVGLVGAAKDAYASTYIAITLQSINGYYVTAEGGGGGDVNANRTAAYAWESFELIDLNGGSLESGDTVYVQTSNFYYFTALDGGGSSLKAYAYYPGYNETFRIYKMQDVSVVSGTISNGNQVAMQTVDYWWVVAEGGGGGTVNANRTSPGAWETFSINM